MNDTTALSMIGSAITDFGTAVLTIVTATLVVGLGYLVFKFGWRAVRSSLDSTGMTREYYKGLNKKGGWKNWDEYLNG